MFFCCERLRIVRGLLFGARLPFKGLLRAGLHADRQQPLPYAVDAAVAFLNDVVSVEKDGAERAGCGAFAAADAGGVVMNDDARFRVAQNAASGADCGAAGGDAVKAALGIKSELQENRSHFIHLE